MRIRKKATKVCQGCKHSDNKKGKWKHTWKRRKIDKRGFWHILCVKKNKYYPWNCRKRCIEIKEIFKRV